MNHPYRFLTAAVAAAFLLVAAIAPLGAQPSLERPRTSPTASVTQKVGVTDISVNYHRPGVKGRVIWGGLVPYDEVWRTGANEVTTITFGHDVTFGGSPVAAGTYGLFTLPAADGWTVILSSNTTTWGTVYDASKDILRVKVTPRAAEHTEWMSFGFTELSDTGAVLELRWEKIAIPVRIGVATVSIVLDRARKEFSAGADSGRWQMLRQAATYAYSKRVHAAEALGWIDRSLAVNRNFASLCARADLQALLGDAAAATRTVEEAVAGASAREMASYALTLRRENRPDRAIELIGLYAAKHGATWQTARELGESYQSAGDREKALSHLREALAAAPAEGDDRKEIQELIDDLTAGK